MIRPSILATAAAWLCAANPANATPKHAATYSSVHQVEEAGDVIGMEVRVHPSPKPWIDFVLCEGECSPPVRLPIVIAPNGFTFAYREALADQDGQPAPV